LVGLLVAIAVLVLLGLVFVFGGFGLGGNPSNYQRKDNIGETVVGRSIARAKDEKCRDYLRQVRQALEIANPTGDEPPSDLGDLRLGREFLECPLGKEPYRFDPAAGTVGCVHPGHEKY